MNPTQLQLKSYYLAEAEVRINRLFDAQKPYLLSWKCLDASPAFLSDKENSRKWKVTLTLKHQSPADENAPYSFAIELVGEFYAGEGILSERVEDVIRVTGTSVLYGVAREVVRSITAMGPFGSLILPTVSFMDNTKPKAPPAPVAVAAPAETSRVSEAVANPRPTAAAAKPVGVSSGETIARRSKT